jgi:tetratricopeptide (TPR) repeat protein
MLFHGRKAEALNPENPLALLSIATAYFFQGVHPTALDHAQRAVQFNPSFAMSHFGWGWLKSIRRVSTR